MAIVPGTSTLTSIPPLLERGKLAFVVSLRSAFASSVTDPALIYDPNIIENSKIRIYQQAPKQQEFFPNVTVGTAAGDASFTYMMEDFVEEETINGSAMVTFAGRVVFTLSLTIRANSTLERERILDHLIIFVRHLFRPNFHAYGIEYTKDIRIGAESQIEVENKPVFEQTIDIPCYMEYEAMVDQGALQTIRSIDLNITSATV